MVVFFAGLTPRTAEGGMSEFFLARGLDNFQMPLKGQDAPGGGWIILLIGVLFASYVMYGWWRDVARESAAGEDVL